MVDLYAPFHISNSVASEVARSIVATWTVSIVCWHWRLFPLLSAFAACLGILALGSPYRQMALSRSHREWQTYEIALYNEFTLSASSLGVNISPWIGTRTEMEVGRSGILTTCGACRWAHRPATLRDSATATHRTWSITWSALVGRAEATVG